MNGSRYFNILLILCLLSIHSIHLNTVKHNINDTDCEVCSVINVPQVNCDYGNNLNLAHDYLISILDTNRNISFKDESFINLNVRAPPNFHIS